MYKYVVLLYTRLFLYPRLVIVYIITVRAPMYVRVVDTRRVARMRRGGGGLRA